MKVTLRRALNPKECSNCGRSFVKNGNYVMRSGLCRECYWDSKAPTPEEIAEECRKIREERPFNRLDAGLGPQQGEFTFRMPRIYRAPRGF